MLGHCTLAHFVIGEDVKVPELDTLFFEQADHLRWFCVKYTFSRESYVYVGLCVAAGCYVSVRVRVSVSLRMKRLGGLQSD